MDNELELVVGTYEDYIVGYRHHETSLDQTFAVRGHSGSVRTLACSPNGCLILSAGYDDMLNIFNMRKRKLVCSFEEATNCATFVGNSHFVCASEDGNIYIYECKQDVILVKTLRGHKGPVISIDSHPSGRLLLSLSKDGTMRTWNLVKGRCAYVNRIKQDAHFVKWSTGGEFFVIAANNELYLYNNLGKQMHHLKIDKRINHIEFITECALILATDSNKLDLLHIGKMRTLEHVYNFEAHQSRIKSIKSVPGGIGIPLKVKLATASSDGKIRVWLIKLSASGNGEIVDKPELVAEIDSGARITSLAASVVNSSTIKQSSEPNGDVR